MLIKLAYINKIYYTGDISFQALKNINLSIENGEFVCVMGASGSGKTTLMNIIGLLDKPTSGTYLLDGENTKKLNENELAKLRNQKIGFVFQSFNLLPRVSALQNVALPLIYTGIPEAKRLEKAQLQLEAVELLDKINSRPNQLSGGQQQRVAIARALVTNPQVILADEPTGNLDSKSGQEIIKILKDLNRSGKTIVVITHEKDIAKNAKRVIQIKDGEVIHGNR